MGRIGLFAAVLLVLAGTAGLVTSGPPPSQGPVEGDARFRGAHLDGDLEVTAAHGALLLAGPRALDLTAEVLSVRVVRIEREVVDSPLAGPVAVKVNRSEETHLLHGARLEVRDAAPDLLAYAFASPEGAASLGATLGRAAGDPFRPAAGQRFVLGVPGQAYAFEHAVPGPAFGVAWGREEAGFRHAVAAAWAEGDFGLALDGGAFEFRGQEGTLTVRAGEFRERSEPPTPLDAPHYRTERVFAVLGVEGGRLDAAPGAGGRLTAQRPSFLLEGAARFLDAEGSLVVNGTGYALHGASLALVGRLALEPRAYPSPPDLLAAERSPEVWTSLRGEASRVEVNGQAIPVGGWGPAATVSVGLTLLGGLAAGWGTLQKVAAPVVVPLYARLAGREVLLNRSRESVYRTIRAAPLIHVRGLQRQTGLGFGTVAYHLDVLRREGLVGSVRCEGRDLLFVPAPGFPAAAMERLALLSHPTRRRIAEALCAGAGRTQAELAAALGYRQPLLSKQLVKLEAAGLVVAQGKVDKRYEASALLKAWLQAPPSLPTAPFGPPVPAAS